MKSRYILLLTSISFICRITAQITFTVSSYTTCIASNMPMFSAPVSVTLSPAQNYTWFPYSPPFIQNNGSVYSVRMSQSTCYTVMAVNAPQQPTIQLCFTVAPQFSFGIGGNTIACTPDPATLFIKDVTSVQGPYTYSWTENAQTAISLDNYLASTVHATPSSPATYTAEVKDAAGCVSKTQTVNVSVANCTGLSNNLNYVVAKVFPVPASSSIYIEGGRESSYKIQNLQGQVVLRGVIDESEKVDVSDLPGGSYYLILNDGKQDAVTRLLIQY